MAQPQLKEPETPLGQLLREARRGRYLKGRRTFEVIARATSIQRSTINAWELGRGANPGILTLWPYAEFLGIPDADLRAAVFATAGRVAPIEDAATERPRSVAEIDASGDVLGGKPQPRGQKRDRGQRGKPAP